MVRAVPRLPISPVELVKEAKAIVVRLGGVMRTTPRLESPPQTRPAPAPAPVAPLSDTKPAATAPAAPGAAKPARRVGKYDDRLAELAEEQPGILVVEAAKEIGVDATALYPVIRRLETQGRLVKRGRELHPPSAGNQEQLWCEVGHTWTRPTVRGRKPKRCPEHR